MKLKLYSYPNGRRGRIYGLAETKKGFLCALLGATEPSPSEMREAALAPREPRYERVEYLFYGLGPLGSVFIATNTETLSDFYVYDPKRVGTPERLPCPHPSFAVTHDERIRCYACQATLPLCLSVIAPWEPPS